MTDSPSSTVHVPIVLVQDDLVLSGEKRAKLLFIVDAPPLPGDLKEAVESLIETGLSRVELMGEILTVMAELLKRDGRFDDLAREVVRYREIVFKEDRCTIPFTMIEARAVMSTLRKWRNTIERRLEAQQL